MSRPTPYKDWALTYLDLGWSPIPLPTREKWPPPDHSPINRKDCSYTGALGKYVDLPDVRAWCSPKGRAVSGKLIYPPDNIALRMPKNVLGIDVDTYGDKLGAEALAGAIEAWGPLPATWAIANRLALPSTRTMLFRLPEGAWELDWPGTLSSVPGLSLPGGVELIRWDHRYSVAPPSIHDEGRTYFWRSPSGAVIDLAAYASGVRDAESADDGIELPAVTELPELPEPWVRGLTGGRRRGAEGRTSGRTLTREEVKSWLAERTTTLGAEPCAVMERTTARWLRQLREAGDDGGAHDVARDGAWAVIGDAAAGHAGVEGALRSLRRTFLVAVGERRGGRSDDGSRVAGAEWERIVIRGVSKVAAEVGGAGGAEGAEGAEGAGGDKLPNVDRCAAVSAPPGLGTRGTRAHASGSAVYDYTRDDRGNARRLYDALSKGADVRYCRALGGWYLWNDITMRWTPDPEGIALRAVFIDLADDIMMEVEMADVENMAAREAMLRFAAGAGNVGRIDAAVKVLRSLPDVTITESQFDADPRLLLCSNGTVELTRTGAVFRPSRREDYLTQCTGTFYAPDAHLALADDGVHAGAALWERFLGESIPDAPTRRWVQKAVGYSLLGANPARLLVVIQGRTSSGKSTFVEAIRAALGDYGAPFNLSLFRSEKDQGPNVALVHAMRQRFIVASEASSAVYLHADEVKRLTGSESLTTRLNNSNDMVTRTPAFTPWIVTNYPPHISGADLALLRRIVSIPFNEEVAIGAEDVSLGERLQESSLPAVLAWAIEGWNIYCEDGGLHPFPDAISAQTTRLFGELNDFLLWLDERTERVSDDVMTSMDDLYRDYELWCDTNNLKPDNKVWFGRSLSRNGYAKARPRIGDDRSYAWRGIQIVGSG